MYFSPCFKSPKLIQEELHVGILFVLGGIVAQNVSDVVAWMVSS